MGEDIALSGALISPMTTDDGSYTTFSLLSGGDNDLFSVQNGNKLHVGSSALSQGTYNLMLQVTDGATPYMFAASITIIPGTSLPQIHGGSHYRIALAQNGSVYVWGQGGNGQLGLGNTSDQTTPQIVPASSFNNEEVIYIYGGGWHAGYVTRAGKVFMTGVNNSWQQGDGTTTNVNTIKQVLGAIENQHIVRMGGSSQGTQFLEEDGTLYSCGENL